MDRPGRCPRSGDLQIICRDRQAGLRTLQRQVPGARRQDRGAGRQGPRPQCDHRVRLHGGRAACYNSPEYTAARKIRQTVSEGEFILVEGVIIPRRPAVVLFVPAANVRGWKRRAAFPPTSSSWTWKTRSRPRKRTPPAAAVWLPCRYVPRETVIRVNAAGFALAAADLEAGSPRPVPSCCLKCGAAEIAARRARRGHSALGDDRDARAPCSMRSPSPPRRRMPVAGQQRLAASMGPAPGRPRQSSGGHVPDGAGGPGRMASRCWTACITTRRAEDLDSLHQGPRLRL